MLLLVQIGKYFASCAWDNKVNVYDTASTLVLNKAAKNRCILMWKIIYFI